MILLPFSYSQPAIICFFHLGEPEYTSRVRFNRKPFSDHSSASSHGNKSQSNNRLLFLTYLFFFSIFSKDYSCWGLVDQSNTRYQLTTKETLLKYYKLEYEVDWTIYTNSTSYTIWCWIKTFHEIFGNFKTLPTELWLALHRGLMINPCFIN